MISPRTAAPAPATPGPLAWLAAMLIVIVGGCAAVALVACAIVAITEPVGSWIVVRDLVGGLL